MISGGSITSTNEMDLWAQGGTNLTLNTAIANVPSLTQSGAGTVFLGQPVTSSATNPPVTVNAGTMVLGSGIDNTLPTGSQLYLNGGTLDLHSNNQNVSSLASSSPLPGIGGTIANSGSGNLTFTVSGGASTTFGGQITDGTGGGTTALRKTTAPIR